MIPTWRGSRDSLWCLVKQSGFVVPRNFEVLHLYNKELLFEESYEFELTRKLASPGPVLLFGSVNSKETMLFMGCECKILSVFITPELSDSTTKEFVATQLWHPHLLQQQAHKQSISG